MTWPPGGAATPRVLAVGGWPVRPRAWWIVLAVPFAISVGSFIARETLGAGWGLLPLLVVGPAVAAAGGRGAVHARGGGDGGGRMPAV